MTEYKIELDPNSQIIMQLLAKMFGAGSIEEHIQNTVKDHIEQIGGQILDEYLDELEKVTPTIKEFKEAGITNGEVDSAITAAKALGLSIGKINPSKKS